MQRYQAQEPHMGTNFHIALYSDETATANRALELAMAEIGRIDRALSNFLSDSELSLLCRSAPHGTPVAASEHLLTVLKTADEISRKSDGAFDATIGPVTKLWRRASRQHKLPDSEQLREALELVDYRNVFIDVTHHKVALAKAGIQLDLGGIAKGYAADRALLVLRQQGIQVGLVNGGGGLATMGTPPGELGWKVTLAPLAPGGPTPSITVQSAGIATSGDKWQFAEIDGKRYSHIIDPRTGLGLTERRAVSVIARNGMLADAWATALSVLDPQAAINLANQEPDVQALISLLDAASGKTRQLRTREFQQWLTER
jgi:thiamine biosynthesis lipoprotein